MKRLHNCVNIVPVIAKADTMTLEERDSFKRRVSGGRRLVVFASSRVYVRLVYVCNSFIH